MSQRLLIMNSENRLLAEWILGGHMPRIGETVILDNYYVIKDLIWQKNLEDIEAIVERKYGRE